MRCLSFILLLLFSSLAWAEDYYWKEIGDDRSIYKSVMEGCHANSYTGSAYTHNEYIITNLGDGLYECAIRGYRVGLNGLYDGGSVRFYRLGDGCSSGKIYNSEKGQCDIEGLKTPEQCAAQSGETAFELDYRDNDVSTCILGCHAKSVMVICSTDPNHPCYSKTNVFYSGAYCDGEDHDRPPSAGSPNPPEAPNNPAPPDPTDPANKGTADCPTGTVKQGTHCVTPPPTDANNGAGNGSGEGGNSGGGSSSNGDGSGSGSGSASGSGDGKGNDKGSDKGKGGGGGGGKGECKTGETCDNKGGKVSGESCDVDLVCEGDAIQCAILKQQKMQRCEWQQDDEKEAVLKGDLEGLVDGEKEAFVGNSKEIPVSNLFNDAVNAGRWMPTACPAPKAMHVFGKSIYLSWEPLCKLAEWIAPLVVLLASLFFAITTAKAVKGS